LSNKGAITIKIGEAFVELITDGRKLTAGLNDAEKQVVASTNAMSQKFKAIGTVMTAVGGVITAAFTALIYKTIQAGDELWDMSQRTGLAVEELSALSYAAKQSGTDMGTVETSLKFLAKAMDNAATGTGMAKDTFTKLGVAVKDSEGKLRPTVEVMKDVATAISKMTNETEQTVVATELFGSRMGTQLLPMLKLGGNEIENLMNKAKDLGIVFSSEDAQAADEFKDKMNDLKEVLGAAARSLANVLIPILMEYAKKAVEIVKKIREWAEVHKPLIEMIVKTVAILGILGAVGGPILLATSAFLKMRAAILAVSLASKTELVPSLSNLSAKLISFGVTSGPIGIMTLAIAGLGLAWKYNLLGMKDDMDAAFKYIRDTSVKLVDGMKSMVNGLKDTLGGGGSAAGAFSGEIIKNFKRSGEGFDEIGNKIETFDEMVARMAEETKAANEAIAKSTKDLANIMQPTYDKLYEMSHTAEEIAVRALNAQKDAQVEAVKALNLSVDAQAAALAKIAELYNIEVGLIIAKLEEEKQKQIEVAIITEKSWEAVGVATRKIRGEYDPLIDKLKELAIVTESSAARQVSALKAIITAQGVLLTNINNIQSAGSYAEAQAIVAANQAKPTTTPATTPTTTPTTPMTPTTATPATIPSGATVTPSIPIPYVSNQINTNAAGNVTSITLPGGGTISIGTKSYQLGTPYVPKTGLYQLHQGEAVIPKNQNTTNNKNSYSPIINVTVQGDGDIKKIKQVITQVLQDSARQFRRSGFELVPGRG
jgi:methyl-accepting chemotaxis protein